MILYIIILAAAIFIVALAFIPWRISLVGSASLKGLSLDARIRFIYGLLAISFVQGDKKYVEFFSLNLKLFRKELKDKEEGKEGRREKGLSWFFRLPQLVENAQNVPELRRPVFGLLSKLRRAIRVKDFTIDSRVGLEDPYSTGVLYGYYTALSGAFGWMPYGINLQPDFVNEGLQGDLHAEIEIVQSSLIIPLLFLVTRKSFRDMVRSSRGKKNESR
ncbi:MAG: DUF2953 domain-containing protein [Archaeoglobaceae archaeon]